MWTRRNDEAIPQNWFYFSESLIIDHIEKLLFEDDEIISECGIVISIENGTKIVVAAGNSPGSVSVRSDFSDQPFDPQFPIADCVVVPLSRCVK